MLDEIDFSKMKTTGAGANNVCFTDGKIAVKLGNVDEDEVALMVEAAKHDLSVPVFYFQEKVQLPQSVMQLICNYPRKFYYDNDGEPWPVYSIKKKSRANVLVMAYAKPLLNNSKHYSDAWVARAERLAIEVKDRYWNVFGKEWVDDHPWNLGYYRQNLVILDF